MAAADAAQRIRAALTDKPRGLPLKRHEHLVELGAGDLAEACASAKEKTQIVTDLLKGVSVHNPLQRVTIQVEDAYHVLDQQPAPSSVSAQPTAAPPK